MYWSKIAAIVLTVLLVLFVPGYVSELLRMGLVSGVFFGFQLVVSIVLTAYGFKKKRYGSSIGGSIAGITGSIAAATVVSANWITTTLLEAAAILILLVAIGTLNRPDVPPTKWHMQKRLVEVTAKAYKRQQRKQAKETRTKQEYRGFPGVNPYFDAWWWGSMLSYEEEQQ